MPTSSTAREAFAMARASVAETQLDYAERPVATTLRVRSRPRPAVVPRGRPRQVASPLLRASAAMARGRVSATKLVEDSLAAVETSAKHNGMAFVDAARALGEAAALDNDARAGRTRGPLHGVPITVKDVIHVAGMPTRAGSAAYETVPQRDAGAVARLRAAGAIVIGKATTHEFALGVTTPQARNPHDLTRIPGGSSGGSAIAVACGIGLASLGTDTRASIRVPSALSGVVGLKPTFGTVPTDGVVTLSWTMDHVGPLARTVADAAVLLDVMVEPSPGISRHLGAPIVGLRIGVPQAPFDGCQPEVALAVEKAIRVLERAGATIVPVSRPSAQDLDLANFAGLLVSRCEAAAFHLSIGTDLGKCWPETRDQLLEAAHVTTQEYLQAQRCRSQLADEFLAVYEHVDVLAMPTSPVLAPKVEEAEQYLMVLSRNCIPWSFVGFPVVSVPCNESGLPVGLQLVAAPYEERVLAALGSAYESHK